LCKGSCESKLAIMKADTQIVKRPALFQQLDKAGRVVQLSAVAGSGKTVLLRSWMMNSGLAARAGWVTIPPDRGDSQLFWPLVLEALRTTEVGAKRIRELATAAPRNGQQIVEQLLEDLRGLQEPLWLVIDDLHELRSDEALRQLQVLVERAPSALRFMLASRHEAQLGVHRLRLAGELTEIRTADLRFTLDESRALFAAVGVRLSESTLRVLQQRTESWAAGLKLAALALVEHPAPERFAAEFCGSERTVAEYFLAEVLNRQPDPVRRLLLRTSMLERVNGALADHLTGDSGGEGILRALEKANAFVFALDTERSWFRYHPLFAEFLRFELRHSGLDECERLRTRAAEWYAAHAVNGSDDGFHADPGRMLLDGLSESESRVLRYLPTHLSRSEIAAELYVSVNTVKTHMRNLFAKLGAHSRSGAIDRARGMGLLAPKPRQPAAREIGSTVSGIRMPSNVSELRPRRSTSRGPLAPLLRDVRADAVSYAGSRRNRA
jgi:ATP/maltotriose-dependent transcriptional regulator MalT